MRLRLTIILVLIVLLPLSMLAWIGSRMIRAERVVMRQQFHGVLLNRLADVDADIAGILDERKQMLLAEPPLSSLAPQELRAKSEASAFVRQYFVLDSERRLAYPVEPDVTREYFSMDDGARPGVTPRYMVIDTEGQADARPAGGAQARYYVRDETGILQSAPLGPLTGGELGFLERTREIWEKGAIPGHAAVDGPGQTSKSLMQQGVSNVMISQGWYAWFWGEGLNLIFWWEDALGHTVGAELNAVRLTADIIGELPDTDDVVLTPDAARIVLKDTRGNTVYQWGWHEPGEHEPPLVSRALTPPLNTWRLEYFTPAGAAFDQEFGRGMLLNLTAALWALALAVVGLAIYYYRESAREFREAQQRISFVNQVSHELKTPLTSIRMYAEMLEGQLADADEKTQRRLGVIISESQRLSRLIANVLTFSRKQRSALRLNLKPGCVDDALREVFEHFRGPLASKGMALEFTPGAPDEAEFDHDALGQIVGNLLNNAEKYAKGATRVDVRVEQNDGGVTIQVADDGPGVPAKDRRRIFDPFFRASDRLTDGVAGTGIGLAIARDLARLHGGDLILEPSEQGACFRVTLTVRRTQDGKRS